MAKRVDRPSIVFGALILLLAGLLGPFRASGQQPIVPLQLSFSDPGARSMAFGGAFAALADDATAAFANPAGLAQLLTPEISIEGRNWDYSTPFSEGGRTEGLPSGFGIDDTVGIRMAESSNNSSGLSFVSIAYPIGDWSLAFFRHQYANLEFSSATQGFFSGGTDCCQVRALDQTASSDLNIVSYGLSAGYRVNESLDVGLGFVHYDASLEANVTQYLPDDDSVASVFALNSYLPERTVLSQRSFIDDSNWTMTLGLLWRLSSSVRLGAVYRQGLETDFNIIVRAGEAVDFGVPPGEVFGQGSASVDFPDIYGLGIAYQAPDGNLTISFQWDRVEYSDIPASLELDDQTIDDANEFHLGAEYVFLRSTPIIALRFGTWLDPDHQMRATTDDPYLRALLPGSGDDWHYSAGVGIATERFQIDVGVDFADRVDTVSLSTVFSF